MSKQYHFVFYVSEKERTTKFGALLAAGAKVHGDMVDIVPQNSFTEVLDVDGACNLGLARAAKKLMEAYLAAGKHFLFFDKGYFQRKSYYRVSVDAWQPLAYFQRFMRPADRRLVIGPATIKDRVRSDPDKVIIFAGACQNYTNFCNLGNVNTYNEGVLWSLREHTERKILYRPNPSWYNKHHDEFLPIHESLPDVKLSDPSVPFDKELERCHLLVTHGTSAAVAALVAGIPNMVLGGGVCKPLAIHDGQWDLMEDPPWYKTEVRLQFFSDLAYCQWTEAEYRDGKAWAELRLVLDSLSGVKTPISEQEVIAQYKLMHHHPNYFRGRTVLKYATEIDKLIKSTVSKTLLDYGSGKGEQYQSTYSLQQVWGVDLPTCYDPGVERFAKLPKGRFDGVICCDVMEHVPEHAVQDTLRRIIDYADKFVFFSIATNAATKTLPDGQNCHLTIKPEEWWDAQIREAADWDGSTRPLIRLMTKPEEHE